MSAATSHFLRRRVIALMLGLLLTASVATAFVYWQQTYVQGQETCAHCGAEREVARRGPSWFRSEPKADTAAALSCARHEWVRSGCWSEDGCQGRYGAAPRR